MLAHEIARNSEAENADEYPANPHANNTPAGFALTDEQVNGFSADNLALKMMLAAVLSRVGRLDPILGSAIQEGFQDATDQVEHMIASCRGTGNTRSLYECACQHQKTSCSCTYRAKQLAGKSIPFIEYGGATAFAGQTAG